MNSSSTIHAAIAGLLALGLATSVAAQPVPQPKDSEKCYGIAKAGKNDCGTAKHACAGLGAKTDNPLAMYLCDVLAIPPNMAGLPGLSIPCGLSEGLPVGLQLIGPQFSENTLFRAGHALERALAFDPVPPRLAGAAA